MIDRSSLEFQFMDLWRRSRAHGDPVPVFDLLCARYDEDHRSYHTMEHIADCLVEFDAVRGGQPDRESIEFALWFHDVVYDPRAKDNELQSAILAANILVDAYVDEEIVSNVYGCIMDTRHKAIPVDPNSKLVVDVDLSILGQDSVDFDRYEEQIRFEYQWVPEDQYRLGRSRVLQSFLDRPSIYNTPLFVSMYEERARLNLARSLEKLK
jgi:predicted metal-dependent HD superfamily phosphohydrolase